MTSSAEAFVGAYFAIQADGLSGLRYRAFPGVDTTVARASAPCWFRRGR